VDSGSSDGSCELAREFGAEVIELDLNRPFTAARARNAGWRALLAQAPAPAYVQFIDGDCELEAGWLETARNDLSKNSKTAVVCGRLRERHPEASTYNRLCDIEWNTPVGASLACGGIAMMRSRVLTEVDGFDESLIAGEEPELCFRLREQGWAIMRLPDAMAVHDADMHSFRQWWRRSRRAGFAYAHGYHLHQRSVERYCRAEVRSIWLWGLLLPAAAVVAAWFHPAAWLLLLAYPLQVFRLRLRFLKEGRVPQADCAAHALNCIAGKFPGLQGMLGFHIDRLFARTSKLIEYK
jgi:GT2 family glycosyltransferase